MYAFPSRGGGSGSNNNNNNDDEDNNNNRDNNNRDKRAPDLAPEVDPSLITKKIPAPRAEGGMVDLFNIVSFVLGTVFRRSHLHVARQQYASKRVFALIIRSEFSRSPTGRKSFQGGGRDNDAVFVFPCS